MWLILTLFAICRGHGIYWGPENNYHPYHDHPYHGHGYHQPIIPGDVMVDVINELGVKLLAIHNEHNDNNIAISPYGALSSLVALGEGLEGEAVHEIQHAAHIPEDVSVIRIGLRDIHRHLKSYFIPKEGFLAGLTFSRDNVTLNTDYEELLKFYGFDIESFNNALYPEPPTTEKPDLEKTTSQEKLFANGDKIVTTTTQAGTTETIPTTTDLVETTIKLESTTESKTTTEMTTKLDTTVTTESVTTTESVATTTAKDLSTTEKGTVTTITPITEVLTTASIKPETTTTELSTTTTKGTTTEAPTTTIMTTVASTTVQETTTTTTTTTEAPTTTTQTTVVPSTTVPEETTTEVPSTTAPEETTTEVPSTTLPEETTVISTIITGIEENGVNGALIMTPTPPFTDFELTTQDLNFFTTPDQNLIPQDVEATPVPNAYPEYPFYQDRNFYPTSEVADSRENLLEVPANEVVNNSSFKRSIDRTNKISEKLENYNINYQVTPKTVIDRSRIRPARSVVDYVIARYYDDYEFHPERTYYMPEESLYFLVNGKYREPKINFMRYDTVLPFLFIPHLNALALSFPLDSSKYYLLLVLPLNDEGVDQLICDLRINSSLKYIIQHLKPTRVIATIPSFMLKGYVTLTPTLQKLGIRKVFEPRHADFSPMTKDKDIYVKNIEQAVTVTIRNYMDENNHPNHRNLRQFDPVQFKADHPFLYFVIDADLHVALMAGKIVNPLNSRIM